MTPKARPSSRPRRASPREGHYPLRCTECGNKAVRPARIHYTAKKSHDGRLHTLDIPDLRDLRCGDCGEVLFDLDADAQISAALRHKLRLLTPDQIRANIAAVGLTQKE